MVFVDESGFHEYFYREHGYSPKGAKIGGEISGKKFERINIIAGYINKKTIAECIYNFNADTDFILAWTKQCLIPALEPGQTVIWDNASIHKSPEIKKLIEDAGCKLIFLPPYSPDLNPIEHFWANLKRYVRSVIANFKTLIEAVESYLRMHTK
jgi:transposase